jgi:hypothetical protein
VIIVLLAAVIVVLIKVRQIMVRVDAISKNLVLATDWLSPVKVLGHISRLFRK